MLYKKIAKTIWILMLAFVCGSGSTTVHGEVAYLSKISGSPILAKTYEGTFWRLDAPESETKPKAFRTTSHKIHPVKDNAKAKKYNLEIGYIPSIKGLENLHASGSAQPSAKGWAHIAKKLHKKTKGIIYDVDLRQESHGFFDNRAVSWYGERNWANIGKSKDEIIDAEKSRLQKSQGSNLKVYALSSTKEPIDGQSYYVKKAQTEEDIVTAFGLQYFRISATDHVWPEPEAIDRFIAFYKKLPKNAWIHFHCKAGKGRTTSFMAMYDMMQNPDVSLKDILYRQYLIGGEYVAYVPVSEKNAQNDTSWRYVFYKNKAKMVAFFYKYVQSNYRNNYKIQWSQWLLENK